MPRELRLRPRVVIDVARIARSIGRTVSASAGQRWRDQVETAIRALANDADQWPEAEEAEPLGRDLRCRLIGRRRHIYRILFTINENTVTVHQVRHAAQDSVTEDDL